MPRYATDTPPFGERKDEKATTQRPPASALLCIDSEDRFTAIEDRFLPATAIYPANDFRIQKSQPLLYGNFKRVAMTQIQVQYRVPTIVANVNDQFIIENDLNQDQYPISLEPGYHSAQDLASLVKTAVLAIPGNPFATFDCSYNVVSAGLRMTCPTPFALKPNLSTPFTDAQKNIWSRTLVTLGANYGNTLGGTSQYLGSPQLIFTRFIDITSSRLAKFQRVKDADTIQTNKSNHVCRVYLTAPNTRVDPTATPGPFDICIDPNTPKHSMWSIDEAIYELDFQMYDEYGQPLFWSPTYNTEFQLTLLASES